LKSISEFAAMQMNAENAESSSENIDGTSNFLIPGSTRMLLFTAKILVLFGVSQIFSGFHDLF
jgi:hypothetical protein